MFKSIAAALLGLSLSLGLWAQTPEAQQELPAQIKALNWQETGKGEIAGKASIQIPSGYAFLSQSDTS